jgi:hypothetical protein
MRLQKWITIFSFILLCIASCDVPCSKAEIQFGLIGFSDAESDTIILHRFSKGTTTAVDSFSLNKQVLQFYRQGDTLQFSSFSSNYLLTSNYDYQFYFPALARTILLSNLYEDQSSQTKTAFNCTKELCVNRITRYQLDTVEYNIPEESNTIFLKK